MTEAEAFLAQARSDFDVFLLLAREDRDAIPECHPLHYLQMATEKLANNPAVGPQQAPDAPPQERRNVEYPWPVRDTGGAQTWIAPCQFEFGILDKMNRRGDYAAVLELIRRLLARFEVVFLNVDE